MSNQQQGTTSPKNENMPWWIRLCRWLWKLAGFLGISVVLALVVNVTSTWLTTPNGSLPANTPLSAMLTQWPLFLLVGCCLLLLALLFWAISRWNTPIKAPSVPLTAQDRIYMLQRLRLRYEQMLSQSLQGAVQMELGLASKPAAIHNAASLSLRLPEKMEQLLPPHTSIVDAYEQAQQELLIMGEPGAGKSTLLLELAHHLVKQAEQNRMQPLPVLLPLSSWANQRGPLHDWLIERFAQLYDISWNLSQQWILSGLVLPLLDGLDEMDETARPKCIGAINTYHREHMGPLVVCSRTDEYQSAATCEQLVLHTAVVVQPLSFAQIDVYLATLDKPLTGLRATLHKKNTTLQAIATTPLMLQILMLTYHDTSVRALSQKGPLLQKQIWTDYVQHMISRKGDEKQYPLMLTTTWLSWLARQLRAHNQTIFFLEQIQPDWLPSNQRIFYQWSTRIVLLLFVWLVSGLAIGLGFGQIDDPSSALFLGIMDGLLATFLFSGIFIGPYLSKHYKLDTTIELAEVLSWSWKETRSKLLSVPLYWVPLGVIVVVIMLVLGGPIGVFFGLIMGLVFFWTGGLLGKQLTDRLTLFPNEGIQRSLKHGLLIGLLTWLVVGVAFGLFIGHLLGLFAGLDFGLYTGLLIGLLIGLDFGLNAALQHFILRFLLVRSENFPWKAVPFLEDATARILLRRVGGGYSFTHRLLLDYFADLDTTTFSTSTGGQSTPKTARTEA